MPFSSGTFSLFAGSNPVVTGTTIASAWANNTLGDIASNGLSYCVLKDGTQTMTANLPMSGFRITGLGAASARTDAARLAQIQDSTALFIGTVAGTNTVTGVLTPAITAYASGQQYLLTPAATNTGAVTLNLNGVGAGAVQQGGIALTGGELTIGIPAMVAVVTTTPVFEIVANGVNLNGGKLRAANLVLAGPTSGAAAVPTFRSLVPADVQLFSPITNSLSANVSCSVTANYYQGPIVAQGTAGTWFVSGTVTFSDTSANAAFFAKLWDGTTVIDSGASTTGTNSGDPRTISLSGYIVNPAGSLRISLQDTVSTNGTIRNDATGNGKDSTITAIRIA